MSHRAALRVPRRTLAVMPIHVRDYDSKRDTFKDICKVELAPGEHAQPDLPNTLEFKLQGGQPPASCVEVRLRTLPGTYKYLGVFIENRIERERGRLLAATWPGGQLFVMRLSSDSERSETKTFVCRRTRPAATTQTMAPVAPSVADLIIRLIGPTCACACACACEASLTSSSGSSGHSLGE